MRQTNHSLRTYLPEDILRRALACNSYQAAYNMDITDLAHLVSDADTGEDKMGTGSARTGKTVCQMSDESNE